MGERDSKKYASGWSLVYWDVLKRPPDWLAAACHILALLTIALLIFLTLSALWRLAFGVGDYDQQAGADHARNLLIAVGAIIAAPFVVWRTWIGHQQWVISTKQLEIQNQTLDTGLITKSIDLLGSNKTESRIGGILILKRIAINSIIERPYIVDILVEYLRSSTSDLLDGVREREAQEHEYGPVEYFEIPTSNPDVSVCLKSIIDIANSNYTNDKIIITNIAISGIDLSSKLLSNTFFNGCILMYIDFSNSIFENCKIDSGMDVHGCEFYGADLSNLELIAPDRKLFDRVDSETRPPIGYEILNQDSATVKPMYFGDSGPFMKKNSTGTPLPRSS